MFAMNSAYTLENLSAKPSLTGQRGISVSFTVTTGSVPSDYTVILANPFNKVYFRRNPEKALVAISTYNLTSGNFDPSLVGVGSWAGQQETVALTAPYGEARVTFEVKGNHAYASLAVASKRYDVSYDLPVLSTSVDVNNDRNVKDWKVYVESRPVSGQVSDTSMTKYVVTADSSTAGSVTVEYITLTATNIINKYVEIADSYATEVAANLAQASTMQQGVDFEVIGNRLTWAGYAMDIPSLVEGMTLRIIYYSGTYGAPYYQKIGKRVVGIGGHGEVTNG